jgi:hypothetical protein
LLLEYVAVIVAFAEGMITVVETAEGLARIPVSPVQPVNCWPPGGVFALTFTDVPAV